MKDIVKINGVEYQRIRRKEDNCHDCDLCNERSECVALSLHCDGTYLYKRIREQSLADRFNKVCDEYIKAFIKAYFMYDDGSFADFYWIGNKTGELAEISDYVFDFVTIRYAVDNNINRMTLFDWLDYQETVSDFGITTPNFEHWCMGAPRLLDEQIKRIATLKQELNNEIEKIKNKMKGEF